MLPVAPIAHHADLIARLASGLPPELDRLALPQALGLAASSQGVAFGFAWRDVPFSSAIEGRGNEALLKLTGAVGPMPFSIEAGRTRRRALRTLAEACRATALDWRLTTTQQIVVSGEARLPR